MAVEDHGLEVLKKSGKEKVPGSKAEYVLEVSSWKDARNSLGVEITPVISSPTRLITPGGSTDFIIMHKSVGKIIYIGDDTVTTAAGFPLATGEQMSLKDFQANDNNEIYAISASSTIDTYVIGAEKI